MKLRVLLILIITLCDYSSALAKPAYDNPIYWNRTQTYESAVKPSEVVVIYNKAFGISDSVKNYYVQQRNIPESNIIAINIPDGKEKYGATYDFRSGQITGSTNNKCTWRFYQDFIEIPVMNAMKSRTVDGTTLKEKARFIVTVRGVPHTLNTTGSYNDQYHYNASVDALLCLLFQDFMDLFGTHYRTQFNAYYAIDMSYTFDYRFKGRHFSNGRFYLSYLVSRLDGGKYPNNYQTIKQAIDNGVHPDKTGQSVYVLDDKNTRNHYLDLRGADRYLTQNDFETVFDTKSSHVTSNNSTVMGYSSHGVHAKLPQDYIMNTLTFNYAKGAVFNTAESFNGWSFNEREAKNQGLIADFISRGGTGGIANVHEPYSGSIARTSLFFPAYAMGYSLVESAYMSIPYLGWQQTVIGDPFTTIAQGKDGIVENTTWDQDMIVTGDVFLADGCTLNVSSGTTITFREDKKLYIYPGAKLILEEGSILKTFVKDAQAYQTIDFVTGTENIISGEFNITQISSSTDVTIESVANTTPPNIYTNKTLNRFYRIDVDEPNYQARIVLPYNECDIAYDRIKEENLILMYRPTSESQSMVVHTKGHMSSFSVEGEWQEIGGYVDTLNNTITFEGNQDLGSGIWAIVDPSEDYILPVSLLSFEGQLTKHGVKLEWETSSETDNAGFVLFRNGQQIASYHSSSQLRGHGTTSQQQSYTFTDFYATEGNSYEYKIRSIDYSGEIHDYDFNVSVEIESRQTQQPDPRQAFSYELNQNYPNPFNPSTTINYSIDKESMVRLEVYDLLGRLVQTLVNEKLQPGAHSVTLNAANMASGTYIYRLQSQNRVMTKKMMLIK